MNINRYLYMKIILGWGFGQALNLFISIDIGGSILTGEIGGVIYTSGSTTSMILSLILVGIGGLIGGTICGFFLSKVIIELLPKKNKHYYIYMILGWALAFMLGNLVYYSAEISMLFGDQLQSFFMFFITIISILIIGSIGGISTSAELDISSSGMLSVIGCWCLGLLLGRGIGQVATNILVPWVVPLPWNFFIEESLLNGIYGFLYGAIAGWFGFWVMFKIIKREQILHA